MNALPARPAWEEADARLRTLARLRAGQDYEEGVALLQARRMEVHRKLAFASFLSYVESVLGYDPRTTLERLRVAECLETLPVLSDALRDGRRNWSTVRELTRVAITDTEQAWFDATAGMNVRAVERMVAQHDKGDLPGDPPRDRDEMRTLVLRMTAERMSTLMRAVDQHRILIDRRMSIEEALLSLAEQKVEESAAARDTGRAPNQVMHLHCDGCQRTFVTGKDGAIPIRPDEAERVSCDATVVRGAHAGSPGERAKQTVAPATRRLVMARAKGRCEIPGCRARHGLETHHIRLKSEGGTDEPANLIVLCGIHHGWFHQGYLRIEGQYPDCKFQHADGTVYGDPPRPGGVDAAADAYAGLRAQGFKDYEARGAIAEAQKRLRDAGTPETVEAVLLESLRLLGEAARKHLAVREGADGRCAHVGTGELVGVEPAVPYGGAASARKAGGRIQPFASSARNSSSVITLLRTSTRSRALTRRPVSSFGAVAAGAGVRAPIGSEETSDGSFAGIAPPSLMRMRCGSPPRMITSSASPPGFDGDGRWVP